MKRNDTFVAYEEDEQIAFVQWCRLHNIVVHHSGNELAGSTPALRRRGVKMKRLGTSKGFPDLLVFIPVYGATGEVDCYQMCAVELKRRRGGRVTKEQKQWLQVLESAGIPCAVCKGAENAIEFINKIRKEIGSNEGT